MYTYGFFLVNDMQTPPSLPPPLQKWPNWVFIPKCCAMFWNKLFLRFLVFQISRTLYSKYLEYFKYFYLESFRFFEKKWLTKDGHFFCPKRCATFWNLWKKILQIFSFWDMVDFILKILRKLNQNVTINYQIIEFCSDYARDYVKTRFKRL